VTPLDGYPQVLGDGRVRTRYQIRSMDPNNVWAYRCFQPDRFTDLDDSAAPRYDDADWGHIEFDVVEPATRPLNTTWMVLLDAGGMSIAEDTRWTTPLDAADPQSQDEVIMPWPGSALALECTAGDVGCALHRSSRVGGLPSLFTKANEAGMWRMAADRQWLGDAPAYEGLDRSPFNPFVEEARRVHPDWGFVELSGCARDNLGGDPEDAEVHRDRTPWGYDALRAALRFMQREYAPSGVFLTGGSSGGVSTFMAAGRLSADSLDTPVLGYLPDGGGADYDAFRRHKDAASANRGWHWLEGEELWALCQPPSWTMGEVYEGVVRHARGFRAQDLLADIDGRCPAGEGCIDAPVLLGTTTRDYTVLCGAEDVFADVYGPTLEEITRLRETGRSLGHASFVDHDATTDLVTCRSADQPIPDCADPVMMDIPGTGHTVAGSALYRTMALGWMECLIAADGNAEASASCAVQCEIRDGTMSCRRNEE
jgi:hypothetical protein